MASAEMAKRTSEVRISVGFLWCFLVLKVWKCVFGGWMREGVEGECEGRCEDVKEGRVVEGVLLFM